MRVPRVWRAGARTGELVELSADEAHHLVRVLRHQPGDEVLVAAGEGSCFRAHIEKIEPGGATPRVLVRVEEPAAAAASSPVPWSVAVAPVKSSDMDLAVRLASELGLERLVPLVTERGQVKAESSGKPRRWERIARESAKQCGRSTPLVVPPARDLEQALREAGPGNKSLDRGAGRAVSRSRGPACTR